MSHIASEPIQLPMTSREHRPLAGTQALFEAARRVMHYHAGRLDAATASAIAAERQRSESVSRPE